MAIRILLADDHKIVREGIKLLLNRQIDMQVVAEAGDGEVAVSLTEKESPDVIVMDVKMPELDGIEATRMIIKEFPKTRIVALSMYADKNFVSEMLKAGASGFLLKDCASTELVAAVRTVMNGKMYLGPSISNIVAKMYVTSICGDGKEKTGELSAREKEILIFLAEGWNNREIAEKLHLSIKTVGTHRQNIMHKLSLNNIADLVKYAIRKGWVSANR